MTPAGPDRLDRAAAALQAEGVDALLVGPGADLRYLVGYDAPPLERLTLLLARADGDHALVVPRLEAPRARDAGLGQRVDLVVAEETDDPFGLVADRLAALGGRPRLALGDRLWATFVLGLQEAIPGASWVRASTVTAPLRMRKDAEEVAALRRAGQAIDRVHAAVGDLLRPGRSEAEVAEDIGERILAEGHEAVSFVIVASGPNGASPHHEPGPRRLAVGDAVVVDIGGTVDGYGSDCTRNYVVGGLDAAPQGYLAAHRSLEEAQEAACRAVRPGVAAEEIDAVARAHLADAGYGEAFVHRTGHGIGLEEHEEPYLVEGNRTPLAEGMAFSVEPGIYLEGRFGQRIEDILVVTADGAERLNRGDRGPTPAGTAP
ncbi:MAG: M24 family metallopeptidase [Actinomycetota bacterium]